MRKLCTYLKDLYNKYTTRIFIILAVLLFAGYVIVLNFPNWGFATWFYRGEEGHLEPNAFGDAFGSYNAIVGTISAIILIRTLILQQRQIRKQEEDSKFQFLMELLDKQLEVFIKLKQEIRFPLTGYELKRTMVDIQNHIDKYLSYKYIKDSYNAYILNNAIHIKNDTYFTPFLQEKRNRFGEMLSLITKKDLSTWNQQVIDETKPFFKSKNDDELESLHKDMRCIVFHSEVLDYDCLNSNSYFNPVISIVDLCNQLSNFHPDESWHFIARVRHALNDQVDDCYMCFILYALYIKDYKALEVKGYVKYYIIYKDLFGLNDEWLKKFAKINPEFKDYLIKNGFSKYEDWKDINLNPSNL